MKSIKLLLLSSIITLISAMLIQPVIAKQIMTLHQLDVGSAQVMSSEQALKVNSLFINLPKNPVNSILNQQNNRIDNHFSGRLFLSSVSQTTEKLSVSHINSVNNQSDFFETAMIFNDKMQQFISYFKNHNYDFIDQATSVQDNHKKEIKNLQKECSA